MIAECEGVFERRNTKREIRNGALGLCGLPRGWAILWIRLDLVRSVALWLGCPAWLGNIGSLVHESFVLIFDDCRVRGESGFLFGLSEYGQRDDWAVRDIAAWCGAGGALFCFAGAVARIAYRSLSRSLRVDVAIWMASGADLFGFGTFLPSALRWSVCPAFYPRIFRSGTL